MNSIYKGAHAVLLTIDVNNEDSAATIHQWVEEIKKNSPANIQIFLVGTKADISSELRKLSFETLEDMAKEMGFVYMEISSKTGLNVDALFCKVVSDVQRVNGNSVVKNMGSPLQPRPLGVRTTSAESGGNDSTTRNMLANLVVDCSRCSIM
jgi:GTPase SAR1 family protein